jgi:hypothetical protein
MIAQKNEVVGLFKKLFGFIPFFIGFGMSVRLFEVLEVLSSSSEEIEDVEEEVGGLNSGLIPRRRVTGRSVFVLDSHED